MTISSWKSLGMVALSVLAPLGCTYGKIIDGSTGQPLASGGVLVSYEPWNTSTASIGDTPASYSLFSTVGSWPSGDPNSHGAGGWYYFNPYAKLNPGDQRNLHIPEGWMRIVVGDWSGRGYNGVFYRNHHYLNCNVYYDSPYSGGPYPFSNASGTTSGACQEEDLTVWPAGTTHDLLPDFIIDPRTLRDIHVTYVGGRGDCKTKKCLSFSTGIANVGAGDFAASAYTTSMGIVTQTVYRSDRSVATYALSGANFGYDNNHGHFHMQDFVVFRIRPVTASCTAENTAIQCNVVATSAKIGFCLFDHYTLDAGLPPRSAAAAYREGGCTANAGTSNIISVGLSPGQEETYEYDIAHQSVDISTLADGTYWLEAEVNTPSSPLIRESDTSNNVSRIQVKITGLTVTAL